MIEDASQLEYPGVYSCIIIVILKPKIRRIKNLSLSVDWNKLAALPGWLDQLEKHGCTVLL